MKRSRVLILAWQVHSAFFESLFHPFSHHFDHRLIYSTIHFLSYLSPQAKCGVPEPLSQISRSPWTGSLGFLTPNLLWDRVDLDDHWRPRLGAALGKPPSTQRLVTKPLSTPALGKSSDALGCWETHRIKLVGNILTR